MNDKQMRVLKQLGEVELDNLQAQKLLDQLTGCKIDRAFLAEFKRVLAVHRWTVECPKCHVPANVVIFTENRVAFSHRVDRGVHGRTEVIHASSSRMPNLTLVPKPPPRKPKLNLRYGGPKPFEY